MPTASVVANWLAGWGTVNGSASLSATGTLIATGTVVSGAQQGGGRPHRFAPAPDAPTIHGARVHLVGLSQLVAIGTRVRPAFVVTLAGVGTLHADGIIPTHRDEEELLLAGVF